MFGLSYVDRAKASVVVEALARPEPTLRAARETLGLSGELVATVAGHERPRARVLGITDGQVEDAWTRQRERRKGATPVMPGGHEGDEGRPTA